MTTSDYPIFANSTQYQAVAASQSNAALGPGGGAAGDYLSHLTVVPASTSPGAVTIADGAGTAITVFAGGGSSLSVLVPFTIAIGAKSTSGAWKVTAGTSVSVVACGQFT
jgi:hypothetical protein